MSDSFEEKIEKSDDLSSSDQHASEGVSTEVTDSETSTSEPRVSEPLHEEALFTETESLGDPLQQDVGESAEKQSKGKINLAYASRTDVGLVRDHNEDNFLIADYGKDLFRTGDEKTVVEGKTDIQNAPVVFSVCDGMGGAAAGEVASKIAVDCIQEVFLESTNCEEEPLAKKVVEAVEIAGYRIFETAQNDRSRHGMGTTSTVAAIAGKTLFVGQVGDSRAYILRGETLTLITKDQSLVNQLIEAGQLSEDEAEAFEHSNIILQALGTTQEVEVDITFHALRKGDRLLLCSDGLSGLVHHEVMRSVLMKEKDPHQCTKKLVDMAKEAGGHDNITVVIADFDGEGLELPTESDEVKYEQYQKLAPKNMFSSQGPLNVEELNAMMYSIEQGEDSPFQDQGEDMPIEMTVKNSHASDPPNKKYLKVMVAVGLVVLWMLYLFSTRT